MDRRDFIKSGLFAAAVGAVSGPKVIAQEAEKQAVREQLAKDILNYNPQMQYRPMGRTGVNVSALGFGMLRLPMKNGHVNFDQTTPMVRRAIEGGVNYIDTGRVYLGGESEQAVGKALAGGWRDRVYVTPHYRNRCHRLLSHPHDHAPRVEELRAALQAHREDGTAEGAGQDTLHGVLLPRQPATLQKSSRIYARLGFLPHPAQLLGLRIRGGYARPEICRRQRHGTGGDEARPHGIPCQPAADDA